MLREIRIDAFAIHLSNCPHYCRDVADKVRWAAYATGMIKAIRLKDEVKFLPQFDIYQLLTGSENIKE